MVLALCAGTMPRQLDRLFIAFVFLLAASGLSRDVRAQSPGAEPAADSVDAVQAEFDGSLNTILVATGLVRPTFATAPPGDFRRLFIVEQDGTIRVLENRVLLATPFL